MPQVGKIGNDVVRTVTGALVGGSISEATGGKFANGAVSGAIQGALAGRSAKRYPSFDRGTSDDPAVGDAISPDKRQNYVRGVMKRHSMRGAGSAVYNMEQTREDPAYMDPVTGVVHVNPSAFEYSANELGYVLFHESLHVEQFYRYKAAKIPLTAKIVDMMEVEAYARGTTSENPFSGKVSEYFKWDVTENRLNLYVERVMNSSSQNFDHLRNGVSNCAVVRCDQ